MDWKQLNHELGNIDLYWLDFILKGYLLESPRILDAGCGEGRNLSYALKNKMDIFGIDQNPEAIQYLRLIARQHQIQDIDARFQVMKLDKILFPSETFDIVICSAVLHFAHSKKHFNTMLSELVRVLKPDGRLLIRTMTNRYLPEDTTEIDEDVYRFANGQTRFVINAEELVRVLKAADLVLLEPYKEVVVQNRHSMGTFMLRMQL